MSRSWRAVLSLSWRESRNSRRRLLLFMSSISIGVAALVAIDSYSSNVTRSVREQARTLLGADLALSSRRAFPERVEALLDSLPARAIPVARLTSFASMAVVARTEGTRLVQVRAVTPEYPFYGTIETEPRGRWAALSRGRNALVDPSLLIALDARVGDSLVLGYARFAILGTLRSVPGEVGVASAFGARVYIPAQYLKETGLLGFGSRAEYEALLRLPESVTAQSLAERYRPVFDSARVRVRTVQSTEQELTEGVEQLNRFLGVVGLVALLLGGIGVASAIHAYVAEKVDTVAVLRCLGATSGQVLAIYVLEAAALGLLGAAAGVLLGIATQFALPPVLGDFIPVDVDLRLEPWAMVVGLSVGVWVATIFALWPLLALRRVSPLQALRRDADALARRPFWRDPARLTTGVALLGSVVWISVLRTGDMLEGLAMSAAIAGALAVLWVSAAALSGLARRMLRERWPFVVRQGVANLYRPSNQTRPVIIALGFGTFLISTLYLVHANLLQQLSLSSAAAKANLAFFDVQEDQVEGLDSLVRGTGMPVLQRVPIVPMRVAAIGGRSAAELARTRPSWALRREYRSSYRDSLVASERLLAGTPFPSGRRDAAPPFDISVERDVAAELGVGVGDEMTWDVQGVRIPTRVRSIREVNWARFEPNFFIIFDPDALEGAPKSFVLLTRASDAGLRGRVQRAVVDRYPNISSIDLSLIQQTIGKILDKVAVAIRFMAVFSAATGTLVLVSAVAASRRQRIREGVLLKTLGATRGQIGRIMLAEYAVLGALGSATGMVLSVAGAWALMRFVFESPFALAVTPLFVLAGATMLLTVLIGLMGGRDVFAATPLAALREA